MGVFIYRMCDFLIDAKFYGQGICKNELLCKSREQKLQSISAVLTV